MLRSVGLTILFALIFLHNSSFARQQPNRAIALEIATAGAATGDHQEWSEILADVGADRVRIVSSDDTRPGFSEAEYAGEKVLTVKGYLDSSGTLVLPGGKFTRRDADKIRQLINKLRADGAEVTLAEKMAFGLTAEQLIELSQLLAAPCEFNTKGERIGAVVEKIQSQLKLSLASEGIAQTRLAGADLIAEEMRGLSLGTVLAASIRPLGLVISPQRPVGGAIELRIVDSRGAEEHWPIGWPLQQTPGKTAPALFKRINFELNRAPLPDALDAVQKKTKIPILFDHNSLAREGVELAKIRVTFNKKDQTYFGAIDDLVAQARPRLKLELRTDEAMQPFLWISTAKQ